MSDFDLLMALQRELIETLRKRKDCEYLSRDVGKTKIRRLRLQLNEIMLRVERQCDSFYTKHTEDWE